MVFCVWTTALTSSTTCVALIRWPSLTSMWTRRRSLSVLLTWSHEVPGPRRRRIPKFGDEAVHLRHPGWSDSSCHQAHQAHRQHRSPVKCAWPQFLHPWCYCLHFCSHSSRQSRDGYEVFFCRAASVRSPMHHCVLWFCFVCSFESYHYDDIKSE